MCRYIAYIGPSAQLTDLLYEPANGLIHQASDAMESRTHINADGFGVGWYGARRGATPAVFKDVTPAWNNANLRSLAHTIESECIVAHVRAARRTSPISRSNCHPFQDGRLLWMHNGDVPGRGRLLRHVVDEVDDELIASIDGSTDTEFAFALFRSYLRRPFDRDFDEQELVEALERTVRTIAGWQDEAKDTRALGLNFCVTDGRILVSSRFAAHVDEDPTLHYFQGSRFTCRGGAWRMDRDPSGPRAVLVASEPLFDDPDWIMVEPDTLLLVRNDRTVEHLDFTSARPWPPASAD